MQHFDDHHNVKATFYIPRGKPALKWKAAQDFCHFRGLAEHKKILTLPLGLSTAEIVFLTTMFFKKELGPYSHLGFGRANGKQLVYRSVIKDYSLSKFTNTDHWSKDSRDWKRLAYSHSYGCLNLETQSRTICSNESRLFICSKYFDINDTLNGMNMDR